MRMLARVTAQMIGRAGAGCCVRADHTGSDMALVILAFVLVLCCTCGDVFLSAFMLLL